MNTLDRIESDAFKAIGGDVLEPLAAQLSIAISLKRIADAMEGRALAQMLDNRPDARRAQT